jgi:hypothetical protein
LTFQIEIFGNGISPELYDKETFMSVSQEDSLTVDIIGDSGPFSQLGKSIGYRLTAGDCQFLIDCGAPVFQLLGPDGLREMEGIVGTHAHEDHKRWFTDIALYQKFSMDAERKIDLFGSRAVLEDYRLASIAALERSLSPDSRRLVDFSYDNYIRSHCIAPEPKYRLERSSLSEEGDGKAWRVVDRDGNVLSPDRARVFVNESVHRPRMLFKDPEEEIWVEPESYYDLTDERFYDVNNWEPHEHHNGLTIRPIKASAWHGPATTSLLFEYQGESLFLSSVTTNNPELWDELAEPTEPEKRIGDLEPDHYVIEDDPNNYLQQVWSERRLERAREPYESDYAMVHDVTGPWATVHTDYKHLEPHEGPLLLTHSPDVFTATHPLAHLRKTFVVEDNSFLEVAENGDQFPLQADCYHKEYSRYFVGFEEEEGDHYLVKKAPGQYDIRRKDEFDQKNDGDAQILKSIALYEEIGGEYFPYLEADNEEYFTRDDGRVEHVTHEEDGSTGTVQEGVREQLLSESDPSLSQTKST